MIEQGIQVLSSVLKKYSVFIAVRVEKDSSQRGVDPDGGGALPAVFTKS